MTEKRGDRPENRACVVCGKHLVYTRQHEVKAHGLYAKDFAEYNQHVKNLRRTPSKELVPVNNTAPENTNTIRVMSNCEVVTDGKRIGIVEWIR